MRLLHYFGLLALLMMSGVASAADYYWVPAGWDAKFSSPDQACEAFAKAQDSRSTVVSVDIAGDGTSASCEYQDPSYMSPRTWPLSRMGDSCPVGTEFNASTGKCDPVAQCTSKQGQIQRFSRSGKAPDDYARIFTVNGKPMGSGSQTACVSSCAVTTANQACRFRVDGTYQCSGTMIFTGEQCPSGGAPGPSVDTTSETPLPVDEQAPVPVAKENQDQQPCVYKTDGAGTSSCASVVDVEKEGVTCGVFEGKQICTATPPKKDKTEVKTTVKTTTNPDGSSTTVKEDVATKTVCSGVNSCTTTNTTTKTTINKDANGKTTSSTTTKEGDGATNGEDGGLPSGTCTSGPDCGDAAGPVAPEDWYEKTDDTYAGVMKDFSSKVQQSPVFQAPKTFFDASGIGGSCPVYEVSAWVFTVRLDQWCTTNIPWDAIKAIVLACAGFVAFRWAFL